MADVRGTVEWLVDGARSATTPDAVLAEMRARLMDGGVPLWRVSVFKRTLHPDLRGRRLRWEVGTVDLRNADRDPRYRGFLAKPARFSVLEEIKAAPDSFRCICSPGTSA